MICKSLISFRSQIIAQANLDGTFDNVSNGKSTSMRTPGQYLRRLTLKDASKMGLERNAYMDSEIALLGTHGNQEKARVEAFNRATHVFKVYFQAFFNGESDLVSIIKKFNATEAKDAGFDCTGLSPLILQRAMDIAGNLRTWSDKPENSADFLKVCLGFLLRF